MRKRESAVRQPEDKCRCFRGGESDVEAAIAVEIGSNDAGYAGTILVELEDLIACEKVEVRAANSTAGEYVDSSLEIDLLRLLNDDVAEPVVVEVRRGKRIKVELRNPVVYKVRPLVAAEKDVEPVSIDENVRFTVAVEIEGREVQMGKEIGLIDGPAGELVTPLS